MKVVQKVNNRVESRFGSRFMSGSWTMPWTRSLTIGLTQSRKRFWNGPNFKSWSRHRTNSIALKK